MTMTIMTGVAWRRAVTTSVKRNDVSDCVTAQSIDRYC